MRRLDEAQVETQLRAWDAQLQRGEPVCFSVSRLKAVGALVALVAFAALGVWIMLSDDGWGNRVLGAACVLLFLAAGAAASSTLRHARDAVRVDATGVEIPGFSVGWRELAAAYYGRVGRSDSVVLLLAGEAAERYRATVPPWRRWWRAMRTPGMPTPSMPLPPWLSTDARLVAMWLDEQIAAHDPG